MIQAGNELLRHASSISQNPRRVRNKTRARRRLHAARLRPSYPFDSRNHYSCCVWLGCSSEKPASRRSAFRWFRSRDDHRADGDVRSRLVPARQSGLFRRSALRLKRSMLIAAAKFMRTVARHIGESRLSRRRLKTTRELTIRRKPRIRSRPPPLCRKRFRRRKAIHRRPGSAGSRAKAYDSRQDLYKQARSLARISIRPLLLSLRQKISMNLRNAISMP